MSIQLELMSTIPYLINNYEFLIFGKKVILHPSLFFSNPIKKCTSSSISKLKIKPNLRCGVLNKLAKIVERT